MAEQLTLPIATLIADETTNANDYKDICEKVKHIRDQVSEFYETEPEFNEAIDPIEQDPQSFTSGKPILKKYAHALLEKMEHERQLEVEEEAKHLTPQQVKADLKHYVSTCEKKIVQQQEQCDALQKQVEQLIDVVSLIACPNKGISPLSMAMNMNLNSVEEHLLNGNINCSEDKDIMFATSVKSVEKLLLWGANINYIYNTLMLFPFKYDGKLFKIVNNISVFLDITKKHYIPITSYCKQITLFNLGPYNINEIQDVYRCISKNEMKGSNENNSMRNMQDSLYVSDNLTPLKLASLRCSLEMVKLLIEKGATIGDTIYKVPNGPEGDLVAGYLQTHGSKPVTRF